MLQDLGSDHLPILLSVPFSPVYHPNERPPSSTFRKLAGMTLRPTLTRTVHQQRNTRLFPLLLLFSPLALNAAKSSIPFGRIKRHPKAWWSAEVESANSETRKAFAVAHRSDKDRQAYISASRCASSVIAKSKAVAWQTTCSSLSPKSNPKSVHYLLRSIAGSSSSPNFPNCSYPRESALGYAAYLRSHFSVSQTSCVAEPEATSLSSAKPRALWSLTCPFALLSLSLNFMRLPPTSPRPLPLAQTKVAYPMLKHLPRSAMDFLLHIFNLFWSSHFFPSIWKTSSIIPIHKMGTPLDSPASFRPISPTSCISKLFERIVLSRLLFFLESEFHSLSPSGRFPPLTVYSRSNS